jgi:hypothetical protein
MAKAKEKKQRDIPKGLLRALAQRKASVDSEALLTDLIDVWGGSRQLSIDLRKEFNAAAPGTMVRQRIMEMLHRLIIVNTTHQIGTTHAPSDMTDEELEETALSYMRKVTSDATPSAP